MQVIIERTLGGYTVSRLALYTVTYRAAYTTYSAGRNLYGEALNAIRGNKPATKEYNSLRTKAGVAISHVMPTKLDAIAWAKSNKLAIYTRPLHTPYIKGTV